MKAKHLRLVRPPINPTWKPMPALSEDALFIIECLGKVGWEGDRIVKACKAILAYDEAIHAEFTQVKST